MAKHKVVTTDAEIEAALERSKALDLEPLAQQFRQSNFLPVILRTAADEVEKNQHSEPFGKSKAPLGYSDLGKQIGMPLQDLEQFH